MQSRRDFGKILLAGIPTAAALGAINSKIGGVQIGLISYSLRGMPATEMIPAIVKIGLGEVELMSGDAESLAGAPNAAELAKWRTSVKPAVFQAVRKQFSDAGIDLRILCFNMGVNITDADIDYAFRMAQALDVRVISSSSTVTVARRVAPVADKYRIVWAAHGHDNVKDPEQFATPEVFAQVLAMGKYMGVNLDIGHFTAAGFDAVPFIQKNHARITNLHLKDRKKSPPGQMTPILNNNYPWGEGDTPICDVLQLLKKERYNIPANIEYEYNARAKGDAVTEVTKCFDYAKKCLA
jgi:sugar phosphate isomerase/epimerase